MEAEVCAWCHRYKTGGAFGCRCNDPLWDDDPGDVTAADTSLRDRIAPYTMVDRFPTCIKCEEAYAVDEHGQCGHCHWETAQEIQTGIRELETMLAHYAPWSEYQVANGLV